MKIKYFLRGLGMGIVFTAVLLTIAGGGKKISLTDEEIMTRARLLGMVVPTETPIFTETPEPSEAPVETETPEPSETPKEPEKPVESEKPKEPEKSEKPVETEKPAEPEYVTVTIKGGMWSADVAKAMAAAGIVSSAADFDEYLCDNGYASSIATGTYKFKAGASYHEIAEKITK